MWLIFFFMTAFKINTLKSYSDQVSWYFIFLKKILYINIFYNFLKSLKLHISDLAFNIFRIVWCDKENLALFWSTWITSCHGISIKTFTCNYEAPLILYLISLAFLVPYCVALDLDLTILLILTGINCLMFLLIVSADILSDNKDNVFLSDSYFVHLFCLSNQNLWGWSWVKAGERCLSFCRSGGSAWCLCRDGHNLSW